MGVQTADNTSFATLANNIKKISKGYSKFNFSNHTTGSVPMMSSSPSSGMYKGTINIKNDQAIVYIYSSKDNNTVYLTFS